MLLRGDHGRTTLLLIGSGQDDAVPLLWRADIWTSSRSLPYSANSTFETTTRNALNILDGAGFEHIPVAAGASGPWSGSPRQEKAFMVSPASMAPPYPGHLGKRSARMRPTSLSRHLMNMMTW
jgi:Inosine-uridine nucleoside N-ribohydrolase